MTEWFEEWFGEEYLRLYPHRDDRDAASVVALIRRHVAVRGRRVLDLACGPGRHARHLLDAGASVVGFDLSPALLARARHAVGPRLPLVRGDMRALPFAPASFDVVANLFTSFGYFTDDDEHRRVLRGVAEVLAPGGAFVIDYFNAGHVRATLVAHEEREVGHRRVAMERRLSPDGRFVIKEIRMMDDGRSFLERVRLFAADELEDMLRDAGLGVRDRFGDYDGGAPGNGSPRAILFAERP
jgi:SAM-dependent methyltransferase